MSELAGDSDTQQKLDVGNTSDDNDNDGNKSDDNSTGGGLSDEGSEDEVSIGLSDRTDADEQRADHHQEQEAWHKLAKQTGRLIAVSRLLVFIVLAIAAAIVTTSVLRYIRNDEQHDFEKDFQAKAEKIISTFHQSMERKLEAVDALSVSITAAARATGAKFPFVSVPDFAIRAANTRILAETALISYLPLVQEPERAEWENFVQENFDAYFWPSFEFESYQRMQQDERLGLPKRNETFDIAMLQMQPANPRIVVFTPYGTVENATDGTGPYLPLWHSSPSGPYSAIINNNGFGTQSAPDFYATITTGKATLGSGANLNKESLGGTGAFVQVMYSIGQYRYSVSDYLGDPWTGLAYPVFDTFDPVSRRTVGVISADVYWRRMFSDLLAPDEIGVYCVLQNTFNQTMTFRLDGPTATYVGQDDLRDTKYADLATEAHLSDYISKLASPISKSYTTADLNTDFSDYTLTLYPSDDFRERFSNNDDVVFTIVLVMVFLFASLVFMAYDYLVGRRQSTVMARAIASSSIVSSLFPTQVRDQLYEQDARRKEQEEGLKKFMMNSEKSGDDSDSPIASSFANATVFFADIAGFTRWSATREPVQVFTLLETLYGGIDRLATRRKVFKVETIGTWQHAKFCTCTHFKLSAHLTGDCYMAVTGVPEAQPLHAVNMVKFAFQCLEVMRDTTAQLAESLGEDTTKLELRIGYVSGYCVAELRLK